MRDSRSADLPPAGIPVAPHIGSGLAPYIAASLQVAAATENLFLLEYQPTQITVADEYFTPSICPREGSFHLCDLPGLGVEPIMEKIEAHRFAWMIWLSSIELNLTSQKNLHD